MANARKRQIVPTEFTLKYGRDGKIVFQPLEAQRYKEEATAKSLLLGSNIQLLSYLMVQYLTTSDEHGRLQICWAGPHQRTNDKGTREHWSNDKGEVVCTLRRFRDGTGIHVYIIDADWSDPKGATAYYERDGQIWFRDGKEDYPEPEGTCWCYISPDGFLSVPVKPNTTYVATQDLSHSSTIDLEELKPGVPIDDQLPEFEW